MDTERCCCVRFQAKDLEMPFMRFLKMGLITMPLPLVLSLLVFWGENVAWS
jgi:Na+/H+ antiporter NhaD/arsenite permease-like protein